MIPSESWAGAGFLVARRPVGARSSRKRTTVKHGDLPASGKFQKNAGEIRGKIDAFGQQRVRQNVEKKHRSHFLFFIESQNHSLNIDLKVTEIIFYKAFLIRRSGSTTWQTAGTQEYPWGGALFARHTQGIHRIINAILETTCGMLSGR
ncbi:MAG: hypothetical protein JO329_03145 [Planctomycetaceae bacterium]|nr:hypothetical protein [Planctomycetaceae bacterium]